MTIRPLFVALALFSFGACAQEKAASSSALPKATAGTEAIGELLASGAYEEVLAQVQLMERRTGAAPRLESLRALALEGAGRKLEAYRSLLVYTQLTRTSKLDDDEAHADLLQLRDKLKEQLQKEYDARKQEDARKRAAAGREVLAASISADRQELATRAEQMRRKQDALIDAVLARPTPETMAELKRFDSPRVRALDPRILRIPQFDTGPIRLGMTLDAFQSLIEQRVAGFSASSSRMTNYVKAFKVKVHPGDKGISSYKLVSASQGVLDDVRSRDYDSYLPEVRQLAAVVQPAAERGGYVRLIPEAKSALIDGVEFDPRGVLSRMTLTYSFAVRPTAGVVRHLEEMFGPATSRTRFYAREEYLHSFFYSLGPHSFMGGNFIPPEYWSNDEWLLSLTLYRYPSNP